MKHQSDAIDRWLLRQVRSQPSNLARSGSEHFGTTRQTINSRLRKLTGDGVLVSDGNTRARRYELVTSDFETRIKITPTLEEDRVWRTFAEDSLRGVPEKAVNICHYGFTEMVNNAIDHSEGTEIYILGRRTALDTEIRILDDGVGIFQKIARACSLEDERHAILELSKGKLTTDPKRHSGEGIFFTSRMVDRFTIYSGNLFFSHIEREDWLLEDDDDDPGKGTYVRLLVHNDTELTPVEIFNQYTSGDDYGFTRTVVPVKLAKYEGEELVSRSQAKRLISRFERFKEVMLDFSGVTMIGQAFADEVFRVFREQHPDVHLMPINAGEDVMRMVQWVEREGKG
jgi:anti-sigma regulatory factor (Ser/Thr protein kinase)